MCPLFNGPILAILSWCTIIAVFLCYLCCKVTAIIMRPFNIKLAHKFMAKIFEIFTEETFRNV